MKRALTLLVALCTGAVMSFNAYADEPFAAVKAIVGRLAGGYNGSAAEGKDIAKATEAMNQFVFVQDNTIAAGAGKVEPSDGKIKISASDAAGASFALGQYMRHTAKINITWCGNRTIETYPVPTEAVTYTPAVPVRFAYNYCTLSYTMAFWSENEWREEIDRLALSGYNVALVLQGLQEAWRVTLESVKKADNSRVYSDEQIMRYVSDEAAQAWWHMGNLEGLGGPLGGEKGNYSAPGAYEKFTARCQADAKLGEYIYAEMMKLGIQPSIQSFVGLVPDCSNQVLADGVASNGTRFGSAANWGIINEGGWQGYTRPDVVNPLNIAFDEMSKAWYGALVNIYKPATHGYTKYMGGDLFHEGGNKGSLTDANLADIAKKIQKTQNDYFGNGNPDAVTWVIQSWQGSPYQGIRNGLDCKKAIIQLLDKDMSTTGGVNANYWNNTTGEHIPWIWVEVLNFGGNTGMHGGARRFSNLAKIGTASGHSASFMGYGILSEGLETNPMMYDMFNDAFTREVGTSSSLDTDAKMTSWIHDYLVRRYGEANVCSELESAYAVLIKTVFDCSRYQEGCVENILCAGGDYAVAAVSKWGPKAGIEYDTLKVHEAARKYLEAVEKHPELKDLDTFKYDFVELFLQILGERGRVINADCATSAKKRAEFLGLIDLAEKITACSPRWRLDWHEARTTNVCAVVEGRSEGIRGYRRMVTSWADGYAAGQSTGLREYAHRGYSGLFKDYYKKRWEWFFQVTEGTISQAKYIQNLTELDDTFPTAVLEPTPEGDMVKIAEEIMEFLYPPALTWNGETDNTWAGANWTDGGTGATVAWTDGMDVNIIPANLAVTAAGQTTGDMTLVDGAVAIATGSGYITTTAAVVPRLSGISLDELASKYSLKATMNGGWVKEGTASAYNASFNADKTELTVQFQYIDDGHLKVVAVTFAKSGNDITAKALWAKYITGGSIGADASKGTASSVATTDAANGYGIKAIKLCRGKLTVNGAITVAGTLYLGNNDLVLNSDATITQVAVDAASAKGALTIGNASVSIANLTSDGTKLVIKGDNNVLLAGKLTLAKSDIAKAVYVGPDGVEQTLVKAADGSVKSAVTEKVVADWIPKAVTSTGLYGVTLEELAERFVITGMMDGGFVPASAVNAYCGTLADGKYTVQMQTVDGGYLKVVCLEFTLANGEIKVEAKWVRNRQGAALGTDCTDLSNSTNWGSPDVVTDASSNGYGIYNLTLTPAVAMVNDKPYTTLNSAISAANGAVITIVSDMTTGAIATYPIKLEVAEGVELKVTAGDFLGWNKDWELHVKGTVDLGGNALSYGEASYAQKIYIYEGGRMVNSSGHGFSVFKNSTIYVKHLKGKDAALIDATLQARENITINVEAGATAVVNADVLDKDGQSGIDSPKIVKMGDGELVWNGYFKTENVSLELNGGTFTRAMEDGETLVITETSGTANITSANEDYKIKSTAGENNVKTYTSVPKVYLVKVTDAGETGQNGNGKLFETFGAAKAYALELQAKTPAILVIMWTVVDNRGGLNSDSTFTDALAAYNTTHGTVEDLDTITAKSPDGEQFNHALWDTTGIYKDPSTQNDVYYPMNATEWTASVKGKTKATDGEDVVMTAEHTVIFNQSYGPLYINTGILPRSMNVTDNSTLKLGFWNGTSSLPSGMTVTIDAGSIAQFDNWTGGKQVVVPNATVNGEGTFKFGDTITSGSHVEIGTLAGSAALTLKEDVTVNVTGTIANTLKGAGTIKVMSIPATFSVAEDANITFVDGSTHDAREVMNVVKNGSTVSITHELIVARVGNTTYADLAAAIAAANVSEGKTITLYISEDDYFRNGAVSVGTADLTGLTVMVRMPDSREEFSMLGTFDPDNQQVTFNVYVRGPAALYDWTFDGNATTKGIASVGRESSTINCDGSNNYQWATDGSMQSKCHPYYGISWNGEFTFATFLSAGTVADTVLVALGNSYNSLALIKDEGENLIKLVKIQAGTRTNVSGSILVPNLSQQHLFMITCSEAHDEIKLWIDGTLWETIALDEPLTLNEGFQIGSIYQGLAGGLKAENAAEPSVKMIRVFGNVLGTTCAKALKKQFEYVSQSGTYQRTISSAEVNWVEDGAWTKLGSDPVITVNEPTEGSTPVIDVTCDTVITVNTSKPMTFEAMSIRGGHKVTFKFADDTTEEGRANKLMPVLAEILEGTTVITQYAAYETLGAKLRLENNAHLKFSYAGLDPWEVLGLTIDGQVSSAIEMGTGSTVEVIKPNMTGLLGIVDFTVTEEDGAYFVHVARVPGQSLDITWNSSVTEWTEGVKGKVTHAGKTYDAIIFANDIVHFVGANSVNFGDGSAMPSVQLVVEDGAKVTMSGRPNVTAINGTGTVAFTEKELTLDESISGTATMEIAEGQTMKTTGSIALPVKGAGKIVVAALPTGSLLSSIQAPTWTGTLAIKNVSGVRDFDLATYGNTNSAVELDGVSGFFPNNTHSYNGTTIIGPGGLTITDGYSTYGVYKFANVSGAGTISMTKGTVHQKFMIGDFSDFTGTIKTTGSPFTVGSTTDADKNLANGTIKVVAGGSLTAENLTQVDFANGKVGVETDVTVTGAFTKEIVLKSVLSTVTGPAGLNVSTSVSGKVVKTKVVGGNTIYGLVTDATPVTPSNPGSTIPVTPSAGTGTIAITDAQGQPVIGNVLPSTTGKYTIKLVENDFEVASSEYAVIAVEPTAKTTTAVAVAFDNMTVATLLNNSLLSEGDTLTAYVGGAYWMWTLNGAGIWEGATMVRSGSAEGAPIASETPLTRGTAVWVTTAGKIVTFGKYTKPEVSMPTAKETHLLANPTMEPYTPSVNEVENDDDVVTIEETPVRYTKVGGKWTKLTPSGVTLPGFTKPVNVRVDANPSIPVGKAFWFIKK